MDITPEVLQKLNLFTNTIKEQFSDVIFVGVIKRTGGKNWDLVVAGNNFKHETHFNKIASIVRDYFQESELLIFSALVVVDSTSLVIDQMRRAMAVVRGPVIIENTRFFNVYIEKAYIFYSLTLGSSRI